MFEKPSLYFKIGLSFFQVLPGRGLRQHDSQCSQKRFQKSKAPVDQARTDRDRAQIALSDHCLSLTDIQWVRIAGEQIPFGNESGACIRQKAIFRHALTQKHPRISSGGVFQQISAPAGISLSGVISARWPSASSAHKIMPSDIMPASLAGFKFVTTITFFPTISSGV